MRELRGRWHSYKGIPLMITYHPAYLLRTPSAKKEVWADMKKVMAALGGTVVVGAASAPAGGVLNAGTVSLVDPATEVETEETPEG